MGLIGLSVILTVYIGSIDSNIEAVWDLPEAVAYFDRLAGFARMLIFDNRGSGISDPVPGNGLPTFETFSDDARFAIDAAGFHEATIIGDVEGGPAAIFFTAANPDLVDGLILSNTFARLQQADDYPIGIPSAALDNLTIWLQANWGTPGYFASSAPSVAGEPEVASRLARYQRMSTTPGVTQAVTKFYRGIDVRWVLPAITAQTLVLVRDGARFHRPEHGRYLAEHVPQATLVELPGADTAPFFIGDTEPALDAIEEFITGTRPRTVSTRMLATVMFTDIIGSTRQAAALGDARWLEMLEAHRTLTRQWIRRYRGKEINTTGDGFVATFDGPTRAVTCAEELVRTMPDLGIEIRAGLHTGEIEEDSNGDIGGLAVHIASRVADAFKEPGVVVSSTVKDLVVGSGLVFEPLGDFELTGIPDRWPLLRLQTTS